MENLSLLEYIAVKLLTILAVNHDVPIVWQTLVVTIIAFVLFGILQRLNGDNGPSKIAVGEVGRAKIYEYTGAGLGCFGYLALIPGVVFAFGAIGYIIVYWRALYQGDVIGCINCLGPFIVLGIIFPILGKFFPNVWWG